MRQKAEPIPDEEYEVCRVTSATRSVTELVRREENVMFRMKFDRVVDSLRVVSID